MNVKLIEHMEDVVVEEGNQDPLALAVDQGNLKKKY